MNPFSKIRLTLQKTLMAVFSGLLSMLFAFILTMNGEMIFWVFWSLMLVSSMLGLTRATKFFADILDVWQTYQVGKTMVPSRNELLNALSQDIAKDSNTDEIQKVHEKRKATSRMVVVKEDPDLLVKDLEAQLAKQAQQLESAKAVIETQNKLLNE